MWHSGHCLVVTTRARQQPGLATLNISTRHLYAICLIERGCLLHLLIGLPGFTAFAKHMNH